MGVYIRTDSKFFWMLLERPGKKPLLESTKIPHDAYSAILRRQQRQDAEDVYRARMGDLARQRHGLPAKRTTTFHKHADWYETHILPTHRGHEREREILKPLRAAFGDRDLASLTADALREYATIRTAAKATASTINREIDLLKSILKAAVPQWLLASPLAGVKRLRTVPRQKRLLAPDEETRLLAELAPRDQAFLIVALDTLARLSNIINLKWSEVRTTHLALEDSKTGPYQVPLSTRAKAALKGIPKDGEYVFPHRRVAETERDRRGAVRQLLKRACARCVPKIPYGRAVVGITFHTATRATGATRMLRAGHDPKTVQAVGHWASLEQMGEYLQTDQQLMRNAVNSITPALRKHGRRWNSSMNSGRK